MWTACVSGFNNLNPKQASGNRGAMLTERGVAGELDW